ncbi:alpha/beta hydrolase-fold protein [Actinomadura rayongensis]|uniref:Esterase n=1 Tax=Actinomadura rayongensis TaxID=1429076 RepID=A0A6I4WG40_9ACTN|nr:hypothetical protein [Actinomadura rayongensis]
MFGPQGVVVLVFLVLAFAGLAWVLARRGPLALRVPAGALAFVVAAVFGMATVNRYYDYYESWGDLFGDLSGASDGVQALPPAAGRALATGGRRADRGMLADVALPGARSGIARDGLVYLPPQYFQPAYARARFPVLELLHGSPGQPSDWQTGLRVENAFRRVLHDHEARPAILVMPDINGAQAGRTGSQCLDQPGGPRDDTYLSADVPADVAARFRVRPGRSFGVAGFSEGGFCAADLALRHPGVFAAAGSMSGYFQPLPEHGTDLFRGNAAARLANDPLWLASRPARRLPAFWLMAGGADRGDVESARIFRSVLVAHGGRVPLVTIPHARHTFAAWKPAVPRLLAWITGRLPSVAPCPGARAPGHGAPVTCRGT